MKDRLKPMKYEEPEAGEWIFPRRKYYYMQCCDCGLVHKMEFKLVDWFRGKSIRFRLWRDNRRTAQVRRHRNITMQQEASDED